MAARVPVLRLLVKFTSAGLRPYWMYAVLRQHALHPRQHDVLVHAVRVGYHQRVGRHHLHEQEVVRFRAEVVKHLLVRAARDRVPQRHRPRQDAAALSYRVVEI